MIPEGEWTRLQREFVGKQFPTPKGGVLAVTGVVGVAGKQGNIAIFSLGCSVCSKDKELFPDGFTSRKGSLENGSIPCGCSKVHKWTPEQDLILTNRLLTEKMPHIKAVDTLEEEGKPRKFILECDVCSKDTVLWPRGSITSIKGNLTKGQVACGCSRTPHWTPSQFETLIKRRCVERGYEFLGFVGEYKGIKTYLRLHNLSNGNTWNANIDNFINGDKGCYLEGRSTLADKLRTPQTEREQQINKVFKVEGGEFVGWKGDYKNANSKFNWLCSERHDCETSVSGFLNRGQRCMICHKIKQREEGHMHGYYPARKDEQDNLYIIHFKKGNYIKVGRSFDVDQRVKQLLKLSNHKRNEIEVVATYKGAHKDVYNTEQMIHSELTKMGFYHNESDWTVETFKVGCQEVLHHLLSKSKLK